jgi:hypothetical protein
MLVLCKKMDNTSKLQAKKQQNAHNNCFGSW